MIYEVVLTDTTHDKLCDFLLEPVRRGHLQEKLCFAIWHPSRSSNRLSALISEFVLPREEEYSLHGNVSFESSYLVRAIKNCHEKKSGLVFIHNHLTDGWQGMSKEDIIAERDRISPPAHSTNLPLVGLTLGTDKQWSARFWIRKNNTYEKFWCDKIRIVGKKLDVQYNEQKIKKPIQKEKLKRTISTWGVDCQDKISRLKFGIIGLGSVGTLVAESLVRMGIQNLTIIDGDKVKPHNLDRLLYATEKDVGKYKVLLAKKHLKASSVVDNFTVTTHNKFLQDEVCYKSALDCDILFSCVDRPLPKDILNNIAYVHYIPVIFGGIFIDNKYDDTLAQAVWSTSILAPGFRCLRCNKQYTTSEVVKEVDGSIDNPSYIRGQQGLNNQNVFPFSMNLASSMVLEMIRFVISEHWWHHAGTKTFYNFILKNIDTHPIEQCEESCAVFSRLGVGDKYLQNFLTKTQSKKRSVASWVKTLVKGVLKNDK